MTDFILAKFCSEETQAKIIDTWKRIEPHAYRMMEMVIVSYGEFIQILVASAITYTPSLIGAFRRGGLIELIAQFKICFIDVVKTVVRQGFARIQRRVSSVSAIALNSNETKLLQLLDTTLLPVIDKVLALINIGNMTQ